MQSQDPIAAISRLGFTERQARFLVLVTQHSGVCLLRQYTAFAGIVHGQKTRKFFGKLVGRRFATAHACRHNRGRIYHVQHKALYRAIGDTDSRLRRPLSTDRIVNGLATLDALLAYPDVEWVVTAEDKAQRLSVATASIQDRQPIGVSPDGRVVLLYVSTEPCTNRFVAFLQRRHELLRRLPTWTLRIVVPAAPVGLDGAYVRAANKELTQGLKPKVLDALRWYFERRRAGIPDAKSADWAEFFRARRAFGASRFELLYRRWLTDGESALQIVASPVVGDAIKAGTGTIDSLVLPYRYQHLSLLVTDTVQPVNGAEDGEMGASPLRPHSPRPSNLGTSATALVAEMAPLAREAPVQ
jgi:hypothetical protein